MKRRGPAVAEARFLSAPPNRSRASKSWNDTRSPRVPARASPLGNGREGGSLGLSPLAARTINRRIGRAQHTKHRAINGPLELRHHAVATKARHGDERRYDADKRR